MRAEPDVYTVDVERMRANRKCANVIVIFELDQAHRAIVESAFAHVSGERNGFDDRFVESVRREDMEGVHGVEGVRLRLDISSG